MILVRKILVGLPPLFLTTRKLELGICLALINFVCFCLTVTYQPYLTDEEDRRYQMLNNRTAIENQTQPPKCSAKRCGINTILDASLLIAEVFLSVGCILTALSAPMAATGFFEWMAIGIFAIAIIFLTKESCTSAYLNSRRIVCCRKRIHLELERPHLKEEIVIIRR